MTTATLETRDSRARAEMETIFESLHAAYLKAHPDDQPLHWIAEAIDQYVADLGIQSRMRWDARHFLLVNLHRMVALPMDHAGRMDADLWSLLRNDVRVILAKAAGNPGEISAHSVLDATAGAYGSLVLCYIWPS
ncbi:MAG TPA: hypothetical protein VH394_28030 [Thermoanaerobaculia bacterium]|jgi:hypothetical protein|nr:hypothetical protein [Thermoanaerobaculia bacterium]